MKKLKLSLFIAFVVIFYSKNYGQELTAEDNNKEAPIKVEIVKNTSFEKPEKYGNHEISINTLALLANPALVINYERLFSNDNSAGISISLGNVQEIDYEREFAITPFYRLYFLNRKDYGASGFFVEAFSSIIAAKHTHYLDLWDTNYESYETEISTKKTTEVALGISLGKKWINSKKYTFEYHIGLGRFLNDEFDKSTIRFGFNIGKRFN